MKTLITQNKNKKADRKIHAKWLLKMGYIILRISKERNVH